MRNRSENQIKLVLIRHGATQSNKEHRYIGKTDEPLCEEGICEIQRFKQTGYYPKVEYLFCSPMRRCMETASIIYSDSEPVIIPEWTEIDFGAFEGKNHLELQGDLRYQEWIDSNGKRPFPEGESRKEFDKRCKTGLHNAVKMLFQTERRGTAGAIVHGGTIMSLLSQYGGGEFFDYQVANGGGYQCILEAGEGLCNIIYWHSF